MSHHSVVFLGTSAFAVPCLKALAANKQFDVQLVLTQPDRPVGRKQLLTPSAVKVAALELKIPVTQPENINARTMSNEQQLTRPDFLVVVSYGQILSEEILRWPTIAAVNVHASLLPKLRGASPIQHAILDGLTETGVTVQRMVKELDAGPILMQRSVAIDERETFTTLHEKLATIGAELLTATLLLPLNEREQDAGNATFCKKFTKADGNVDPTKMTAEKIDRMVRALTPWPGVSWNNNKVLETSLEQVADSFPIPCAENSVLHIVQIQPSGGKPMSGTDFLRGRGTLSLS